MLKRSWMTWCGALAVVSLAGMNAQDARGQVKVETDVTFERWNDAVRITNDKVFAVIVPAAGGRISAFGPAGEKNLLWVNSAVVDTDMWKNFGGDKVWVWPQDDWAKLGGAAWPPPGGSDQSRYSVAIDEKPDGVVVTLVSPEVTGFGVKVKREVRLPATGATMTVVNALLPEGKAVATPLASWTVTQVPKPRTVVARKIAGSELTDNAKSLVENPWPGKITPNGEDLILITPSATASGKLGLDIDALGVVVGGRWLLVQRLELPGEAGLASGERGQLYSESDGTEGRPAETGAYVELEWTGPRVMVAGETSASHTVVWSLHPVPMDRNLADIFRDALK